MRKHAKVALRLACLALAYVLFHSGTCWRIDPVPIASLSDSIESKLSRIARIEKNFTDDSLVRVGQPTSLAAGSGKQRFAALQPAASADGSLKSTPFQTS